MPRQLPKLPDKDWGKHSQGTRTNVKLYNIIENRTVRTLYMWLLDDERSLTQNIGFSFLVPCNIHLQLVLLNSDSESNKWEHYTYTSIS